MSGKVGEGPVEWKERNLQFPDSEKAVKNFSGRNIRLKQVKDGTYEVKVDNAFQRVWYSVASFLHLGKKSEYVDRKEVLNLLNTMLSKECSPAENDYFRKTSALAFSKLMSKRKEEDKEQLVDLFVKVYKGDTNYILRSLAQQAELAQNKVTFFDALQKYGLDQGYADTKFIAKQMANEVLERIPLSSEERDWLSTPLRSHIEFLLSDAGGCDPNLIGLTDKANGKTGPIMEHRMFVDSKEGRKVYSDADLIREAKRRVFRAFMENVANTSPWNERIQYLKEGSDDRKFDLLVLYGVDPVTAKITDKAKYAQFPQS